MTLQEKFDMNIEHMQYKIDLYKDTSIENLDIISSCDLIGFCLDIIEDAESIKNIAKHIIKEREVRQ